jgi:hypothetical protein
MRLPLQVTWNSLILTRKLISYKLRIHKEVVKTQESFCKVTLQHPIRALFPR